MARTTPAGIALTGEVLDWDVDVSEEYSIEERERKAFERKGYLVVEVGGQLLALRSQEPRDGTVTVQAKSDSKGRMASSGGHSNFGYSGYFRGYVFVGGRRRTLVDFWTLFQHQEHHYANQYMKPAEAEAIRQRIGAMAGSRVTKVVGGYAFASGPSEKG